MFCPEGVANLYEAVSNSGSTHPTCNQVLCDYHCLGSDVTVSIMQSVIGCKTKKCSIDLTKRACCLKSESLQQNVDVQTSSGQLCQEWLLVPCSALHAAQAPSSPSIMTAVSIPIGRVVSLLSQNGLYRSSMFRKMDPARLYISQRGLQTPQHTCGF